ncbi:MAG: ParB/RepB/Spo0J family partition protein [Paludibacteraceae bacterium]|nr:ParB/RepB/Spo0J family partition protein [Paludibacteraceae bacterium]
MANKKPIGLGKGLGALLDSNPIVETGGSSSICEIDLDRIDANPNQPRTVFDAEALEELAASIREIGVVQPITLREVAGGRYQIVAGERRYRASKMAGLNRIPAYVRAMDDETLMEVALVENLQREDLNAIEIALGYQRIMDECRYTQERLAERVGKKRATVANYLRLLKLPAEVQLGLQDKSIEMGHARALAGIDDPAVMIKLYEETVAKSLSVRELERRVAALQHTGAQPAGEAVGNVYAELAGRLSQQFATTVKIDRSASGKGKIVLAFASDDELEHIIALLDQMH